MGEDVIESKGSISAKWCELVRATAVLQAGGSLFVALVFSCEFLLSRRAVVEWHLQDPRRFRQKFDYVSVCSQRKRSFLGVLGLVILQHMNYTAMNEP